MARHIREQESGLSSPEDLKNMPENKLQTWNGHWLFLTGFMCALRFLKLPPYLKIPFSYPFVYSLFMMPNNLHAKTNTK